MITKALFSAALAVAGAVGVAAPAMADPLTTTCKCEPQAQKAASPAPTDAQLDQGIQRALSAMQASQGR